jgi:hypothetical protein
MCLCANIAFICRRTEQARQREEDEHLARRIAELAAQSTTETETKEEVDDDEAEEDNEDTEENEAEEDLQGPSTASQERSDMRRSSLLDLMQQSDGLTGEEEVENEEEEDDDVSHMVYGDGSGLYDYDCRFMDSDRPLTATEKRIQLLLRNIRQGLLDARDHPRKKAGVFSQPLLFADDIYFDSFGSCTEKLSSWVHEQTDSNPNDNQNNGSENVEEEKQGLINAKNPFGDIDAAVKRFRKQQEEERTALFKTQVEEIHAADWTNIVRITQVDWNHFFAKQEAKLELIKAIARESEDTMAASEEAEEDAKSVCSSVSGSPVRGNTPDLSTLGIPESLLQVLPDNAKESILPLPFGKVLHKQQATRGELRFFQIEVTEEDCVLTVELKCTSGFADLYASFNKLPSTVKYEHRASCNKENDMLARLTIVPQQLGCYFVAVAVAPQSNRAKFDIWSYATGDSLSVEQNVRIKNVSKIIDKWNILMEHPMDELQIHFPRLEQEALQQSERNAVEKLKLQKKRRAVVKEVQLLSASGQLDQFLSRSLFSTSSFSSFSKMSGVSDFDEEEVETLEGFVVKVGRYALKKEREKVHREHATVTNEATTADSTSPLSKNGGRYEKDDSFDSENPNQHAELFSTPVIHRSRSIAMFTPLQDINKRGVKSELEKLLEEEAQDEEEAHIVQKDPSMSGMRFESVTAILGADRKPTGKRWRHRRSSAFTVESGNSSYVSFSSSEDSDEDDFRSEASPSSNDRGSLPSLPASPAVTPATSVSTNRKSLFSQASSTMLSKLESRRSTAVHSRSLPALGDTEQKLADQLDAKHKLRMNKAASTARLVLLDPKPVSYKLRK